MTNKATSADAPLCDTSLEQAPTSVSNITAHTQWFSEYNTLNSAFYTESTSDHPTTLTMIYASLPDANLSGMQANYNAFSAINTKLAPSTLQTFSGDP